MSLRPLLEYQADRIEAVLAQNGVPGRVTGGTVTPRWVRFQVMPAVGTQISCVEGLSKELATALNAPGCRVSRRGAAVAIEVPRDDPQPVRLLSLFHQVNDGCWAVPDNTAILGLAEDGAPLLIRLPSPEVGHILVAGATGAGKTVLLQAIALSLAMANPPQRLSLVLIAPRGDAFGPLAGLPHLARPVIREVGETIEALQSLVRLMTCRGTLREPGNRRTVVVIDELADLWATGGRQVQWALVRLTQHGCGAGVHVIAATERPTAVARLSPCFPVRLVGRVAGIEDARVASGRSGSGAERLLGWGDFLAVAEGRVVRFQAAYVSPAEIREVAAALRREGLLLNFGAPRPQVRRIYEPAHDPTRIGGR